MSLCRQSPRSAATPGGKADIQQIRAGVAKALPGAAKHHEFKTHLSYSLSVGHQHGKFVNYKDHGH